MADEGYEPYDHVPQQSRRDKLRCFDSGLFPIYDHHSLISSDFLTKQEPVAVAGGGGLNGNLLGFVSSNSYIDPQSSVPMNPYYYHHHPHQQHQQQQQQHQQHPSQSYNLSTTASTAAATGQGLSLSLSSHQNQNSNNLPLELNYMINHHQHHHNNNTVSVCAAATAANTTGGGSGSCNEVSRSTVPLGPFTGYSSILKGSKFLKPAQQLMDDLCDVGKSGDYGERISPDSCLMEPPIDCLNGSSSDHHPTEGIDNRPKKSRLLSMLVEVYRRYKQYYQQMETVVASFEYVAGLSNAAPYANLALKAMSKHFKSLKNAITDQIQFANKPLATSTAAAAAAATVLRGYKDEAPRCSNPERVVFGSRPSIRKSSTSLYDNQPVWRPQRGLPERAVSILRAWLFEHFLHPYPTDTDKLMLAKQTGLTRSQVSNWFINARVRLWKPMVDEIHMLDMRQSHESLEKESRRNTNKSIDNQISSSSSIISENPSPSTQILQENPYPPTKSIREEFSSISAMGIKEHLNLPYHMSNIGTNMAAGGGGGGGVSLTLGLHQNNNNNNVLLEPRYSTKPAQRFGLDGSHDYVMAGFEMQNQHFGRSNVIGGQLLHDFVG